MKICYLGAELETHLLATKPTLDELRRRGHQIEMRIWHYGRESKEITFANSDADLFITDGHYKNAGDNLIDPESCGTAEVPDNRFLWIQISHGISPYKPWGCSKVNNAIKMRLVPTEAWAEHVKDKATPQTGIIPVDGWSKLDHYYHALRNKAVLKAALFKKYGFNPKKPLVVYAPTGARQHALTKEAWVQAYGTERGYGWHGSYYHRKEVKKIVSKVANFYEIPHPTIGRSDAKDRVALLAASNALIGDISSMSLEYIAVNKPIILLRKRKEDRQPADFHLFGNQAGPVVDLGKIIDIEGLGSVLSKVLKRDDHRARREFWRKQLLGTVDGHCAEREADAIERFAEEHK